MYRLDARFYVGVMTISSSSLCPSLADINAVRAFFKSQVTPPTGRSIQTSDAIAEEECANACATRLDCSAFVHDNTKKKCYMFDVLKYTDTLSAATFGNSKFWLIIL
jgi:hypothetical protein